MPQQSRLKHISTRNQLVRRKRGKPVEYTIHTLVDTLREINWARLSRVLEKIEQLAERRPELGLQLTPEDRVLYGLEPNSNEKEKQKAS